MDKRKDANEREESRDVDTRRWQAYDNEGHIPGSKLAVFNERNMQEAQKKEDDAELNKLDDRMRLMTASAVICKDFEGTTNRHKKGAVHFLSR